MFQSKLLDIAFTCTYRPKQFKLYLDCETSKKNNVACEGIWDIIQSVIVGGHQFVLTFGHMFHKELTYLSDYPAWSTTSSYAHEIIYIYIYIHIYYV